MRQYGRFYGKTNNYLRIGEVFLFRRNTQAKTVFPVGNLPASVYVLGAAV